jgi:hypothetical protein
MDLIHQVSHELVDVGPSDAGLHDRPLRAGLLKQLLEGFPLIGHTALINHVAMVIQGAVSAVLRVYVQSIMEHGRDPPCWALVLCHSIGLAASFITSPRALRGSPSFREGKAHTRTTQG